MKTVALALLGATLGAQPLAAQGQVTGRWARDPSQCWNDGETRTLAPLIVTASGLRWSSEDCRIARMYKTGDTVHLQARCRDMHGERSVAVSLRPHGGRLAVYWNRVAAGDLRRCP
jgi:hypothetical protein